MYFNLNDTNYTNKNIEKELCFALNHISLLQSTGGHRALRVYTR